MCELKLYSSVVGGLSNGNSGNGLRSAAFGPNSRSTIRLRDTRSSSVRGYS
jgi:hypothetical protein